MPTSSAAVTARIVRFTMLVVVGGVAVLFVARRDLVDQFAVGALTGAAVVGTIASLVLARRRPRLVPLLAAASYVGVAWPILWLRSLPEDSAAIPIGQVGAMFISLVVMATLFFLLPTGDPHPPHARNQQLGTQHPA